MPILNQTYRQFEYKVGKFLLHSYCSIYIFCVTCIHMASSSEWNATIKKEARGTADDDLGEIQGITETNVVTKVGRVDKETFSIPKSLAEKFDGHKVMFSITKEEAESQYKIEE